MVKVTLALIASLLAVAPATSFADAAPALNPNLPRQTQVMKPRYAHSYPKHIKKREFTNSTTTQIPKESSTPAQQSPTTKFSQTNLDPLGGLSVIPIVGGGSSQNSQDLTSRSTDDGGLGIGAGVPGVASASLDISPAGVGAGAGVGSGSSGVNVDFTAGSSGVAATAGVGTSGPGVDATLGPSGAAVGASAGASGPGVDATAGPSGAAVGASAGTTGPGVGATAGPSGAGAGASAGPSGPGVGATAGPSGVGVGASAGTTGPGVGATAGPSGAGAGASAGPSGPDAGATVGPSGAGVGVSPSPSGPGVVATVGPTTVGVNTGDGSTPPAQPSPTTEPVGGASSPTGGQQPATAPDNPANPLTSVVPNFLTSVVPNFLTSVVPDFLTSVVPTDVVPTTNPLNPSPTDNPGTVNPGTVSPVITFPNIIPTPSNDASTPPQQAPTETPLTSADIPTASQQLPSQSPLQNPSQSPSQIPQTVSSPESPSATVLPETAPIQTQPQSSQQQQQSSVQQQQTSLQPVTTASPPESTVAPATQPTTLAPMITQAPTNTPTAPVSLAATGSDSQTTFYVPTQLVLDTTSSFSPPASTASAQTNGIPSTIPHLIPPPGSNGLPPQPEDTTLIQIGFLYPLNYLFVLHNPAAIYQIFDILPNGLAFGLGIDTTNITMQSLQPFDSTRQSGYITTVALAYIPSGSVSNLTGEVPNPGSQLYKNTNDTRHALMSVIDPSFPVLAGAGMNGEGTAPGGPATTNTVVDQNPLNANDSNGGGVKGASVGIGVGVVAGAAVYGAAMFFVAKRYKKRKARHTRSSSLIDTQSMAQSNHEQMTGAGAGLLGSSGDGAGSYGTSQRGNSRNSGGSGSSRGRDISAPVMAENSLGWN